ncbi:MAG: hypothetical protein CVU39_07705 [Chloroflexi bacterium HGW-Chloroflexi-10]|nr:MAG: hypothetical protein CVU39_07705 [Chloroflexi bacterium HGW-Chloroflexi-10]
MDSEIVYKPRPYNTPIESGLRMLYLLVEAYPQLLNLQRLVYYDYLLVHSGDIPNGPQSLHPATPFRGAEWIVRRKKLSDGLDLMFSKDLISKTFNSTGILYCATDLTEYFLRYLSSDYSQSMRVIANWVTKKFSSVDEEQLGSYIKQYIDDWGSEFKILG